MVRYILTVSMLLAALPTPAQEPTPQATFYRAFYLEEGLRDLATAEKTYGEAAAQALDAGDLELATKAMLARGDLLKRLGRRDEAREILERARALHPERADIITALNGLAVKQEDGLAAEVAGILRDLSGSGAKQAHERLKRLGAKAVGPLLEELEDAPPHVLRTIANHLGIFAGEELLEPFARALEATRSASRMAVAQGVLMNDRSDLVKLGLVEVALKSRDPQVRYAATQGLSLGIWWFETPELGEAFASQLTRGLAREAQDVRKHLLLSQWRQPEAVWPLVAPAIERMARSEDDATRELALGAWSKWVQVADAHEDGEVTRRVASAVADAAADLLAHGDWEVRRKAAETLPWVPEWPERIRPRLLTALRKAIREPDRREGIGPIPAAAAWLNRVGPQSRENTVCESFSVSEILEIYALIGSEESRLQPHERAQLRQLLAQRGLWSRARSEGERQAIAAEGLRSIQDVEGLEGWLQSIRDVIIDADALLPLLEHEDRQVRRAAYSTLIRASQRGHRPSEGSRVPKQLIEDLGSKDSDLRSYARGAADLIHDPDLVPGFRAYLSRLHEEGAISGGTRKLTSALRRLVSLAGKEALPDIRAWLAKHPASPELYGDLPTLLGDEVVTVFLDLAVRGGWVGALAVELKDRESRVAFITGLPPGHRDQVIAHADSLLGDRAFENWLGEILRSEGDKLDAIEVAGKKHLAGLWPQLLTLLEDDRDEVREAAKKALEEIRWYHDVKASLETFGPTGRAEALTEAKKLTSSDDPVQRRGAAFALAALGDPAAIPALLELLKDADPTVREAATGALQRIGGR